MCFQLRATSCRDWRQEAQETMPWMPVQVSPGRAEGAALTPMESAGGSDTTPVCRRLSSLVLPIPLVGTLDQPLCFSFLFCLSPTFKRIYVSLIYLLASRVIELDCLPKTASTRCACPHLSYHIVDNTNTLLRKLFLELARHGSHHFSSILLFRPPTPRHPL